MRIQIDTKLPDYCRTTKNPKFMVVEVKTPEKWLPTYKEIARILESLADCERYNREQGQKQYNQNEKLDEESN